MAGGEAPEWYARRLPYSAAADALSISIDQSFGYLAVQVTFLGEPIANINVSFFRADDTGGRPTPDELAKVPTDDSAIGKTETDDSGIAQLPGLVPVALYTCQIDRQPRQALITTVEDPAKPFVIPLPVGRPYFDHVHPGK